MKGKSGFYFGYTLMELMVVVSIIVVVTMGALANYFWFDSRQRLKSEAKNLVALIEKVRTKAMAMEYPENCQGLKSYSILANEGDDDFSVKANCAGVLRDLGREKVLSTSRLDENLSLEFLAVTGELANQTTLTITLVNKKDTGISLKILVDGLVVDKVTIVE